MPNINLRNITDDTDVRASLIAIKAELKDEGAVVAFKKDELYSRALFIKLLQHEDPKVRKNVVLIMGVLLDKEYAKSIYEAYLKEDKFFVKSAYLKALSAYDYLEYEEELLKRMKQLENGEYDEGDLKHASEELHELKKMFPDKAEHVRHEYRNPADKVEVILTVKKEMIPRLHMKVEEITGRGTAREIFCGVLVKSKDVGKLAAIRIYRDMLFPVNGFKSMERDGLAKEIVGGNLMELLSSLHRENDGPYHFRVSSTTLNSAKIAREIEAASKGRLVNSVSDYEIELRLLENKEGKVGCLLKLFTRKDRRFTYRKNDIATSLHPVNAALIAEVAKEYFEKHATILDPFCGVGTLLIERDRIMKASHIYGVDLYGTAIDYARENGKIAGTEINFIKRDFFDFKHEYLFDEIITEMPRFEKGEADEFYGRFFEKAGELMKDNGVMIIYSCEKGILKKYIRLHKEYTLISEILMDSKDDGTVYIIKKKD